MAKGLGEHFIDVLDSYVPSAQSQTRAARDNLDLATSKLAQVVRSAGGSPPFEFGHGMTRGRWPEVMWVSSWHPYSNAFNGAYVACSNLFQASGKGVYVTLMTQVEDWLDKFVPMGVDWASKFSAPRQDIRQRISQLGVLTNRNFKFDNSLFLTSNERTVGYQYRPGVIVHKYYDRQQLLNEQALVSDVLAVVDTFRSIAGPNYGPTLP